MLPAEFPVFMADILLRDSVGATAHPTVVGDNPNPAWMDLTPLSQAAVAAAAAAASVVAAVVMSPRGKGCDTSKHDRLQLWWWGGGSPLFHLLSSHVARADRSGEAEGRIKTNPLCELVLVAMVTIITSHLGEKEQGASTRGRGEKKMGQRCGTKTGGGMKRKKNNLEVLWDVREGRFL